MTDAPRVTLLGTAFPRLSPEAALDEAERLFRDDQPRWIAVQNAHGLNLACSNAAYRRAVEDADLVLNDGKGVLIASRIVRAPLPADLNGNFFTPLLLRRAAAAGWRVFLLGARPGVAEKAAANLVREIPGLNIVGCFHGYLRDPDELQRALEEVRRSDTELLLVGMGNPYQEEWLERHLLSTGARLGMGVGAFMDFKAGEVKRAPAWMNRLALEWVHRLFQEPRRMWRRYLLGNPLFLWRIVRAHLLRGNRAP